MNVQHSPTMISTSGKIVFFCRDGENLQRGKTDRQSFRKNWCYKLNFATCVFMFIKFSFELFFYRTFFKISFELLFYYSFQFCCKTFIFISIKQQVLLIISYIYILIYSLDLFLLDYKLIKSEEIYLYTFPFGLSCLLWLNLLSRYYVFHLIYY